MGFMRAAGIVAVACSSAEYYFTNFGYLAPLGLS